MPTIRELISLIDTMYPNAVSNTDKIRYMNIGQDSLSEFFGLTIQDESLATKADNDEYILPSSIYDISQITSFKIANIAPQLDKLMSSSDMKNGSYVLTGYVDTPSRISITNKSVSGGDLLGTIYISGISGGVSSAESIAILANTTVYSEKFYSEITSMTGSGWSASGAADSISFGVKSGRYETSKYEIGYELDSPKMGKCIYQGHTSTGSKTLIVYPAPELNDLPITIQYRSKLTELSTFDLEKIPDFDVRYHDLLATFACYMICSSGASPDSIQANRFANTFDSGVEQLRKQINDQKISAPIKRKDNPIWHGYR